MAAIGSIIGKLQDRFEGIKTLDSLKANKTQEEHESIDDRPELSNQTREDLLYQIKILQDQVAILERNKT